MISILRKRITEVGKKTGAHPERLKIGVQKTAPNEPFLPSFRRPYSKKPAMACLSFKNSRPPADKIFQQPQTDSRAFFRVALDGEDIILRRRAGKAEAIAGFARRHP